MNGKRLPCILDSLYLCPCTNIIVLLRDYKGYKEIRLWEKESNYINYGFKKAANVDIYNGSVERNGFEETVYSGFTAITGINKF